MCIAAPGKVVKIEGQKALVEYPGEITRHAMIANEKVKIGSFVLVQMGIIIDVLSKSQSTLAAKAWEN
jgi:hydrogenase expression/formation protein HypC